MNTYKVLKNQEFRSANFKITPIRFSDKFLIMKWRNEQIDILRQEKPLTKKDQLIYFDDREEARKALSLREKTM